MVSTDVIINGRDITFAVNTKLTASETALFYIRANARAVENQNGDVYKLELKNVEDLNVSEMTTDFRATVL